MRAKDTWKSYAIWAKDILRSDIEVPWPKGVCNCTKWKETMEGNFQMNDCLQMKFCNSYFRKKFNLFLQKVNGRKGIIIQKESSVPKKHPWQNALPSYLWYLEETFRLEISTIFLKILVEMHLVLGSEVEYD